MFLQPYLPALPKAIAKQQRAFTVPNLSTAFSALSSFGKPIVVHANRTLHYPRTSLYEIVSDIKSYPQFIPLVYDAQILAKARPKSGSPDSVRELPALASLTVGAGGLATPLGQQDVRFVSNVYCCPTKETASSEESIVEAVAGEERECKALNTAELLDLGYSERPAQDTSGIKDTGQDLLKVCRTRWKLSDLGKGKTEVDLLIEIHWKYSILASLTQAAMPTMAEQVIHAFEKRARDTLQAW